MITQAQMLMYISASRITGGGGGGTGTLSSYTDISVAGQFGGNGSAPQSWDINNAGDKIVIFYQDPMSGNPNKLSITSNGTTFTNYNSSINQPLYPVRPSITYPNRWVFYTGGSQLYYSDNVFSGGTPTINNANSVTGNPYKFIMAVDRWVGISILFNGGTNTLYYNSSIDGITYSSFSKFSGTNFDVMFMSMANSNTNVAMAGIPTQGQYIPVISPANALTQLTLNKSNVMGNPQGVQGATYSPLLDQFVFVADRGYIYTSTALGTAVEINMTSVVMGLNDVIWNPTLNEYIATGYSPMGSPVILKSTNGTTWTAQSHPSMPTGGTGFINKVIWSSAYNKYYCFGQKQFTPGVYEMFIATFTT